MSGIQIALSVLIMLVFGSSVISAFKCYTCSAGDVSCPQTWFVTSAQQDGCTCCKKHIQESGTSRECGGILDCAVAVSDKIFLCMKDYCNSSPGTLKQSPLVALLVASAALLASIFSQRLF